MVNARLIGLNVVTDVSPEAAVWVLWRANVLGEHATGASHDLCGSIHLILQARLELIQRLQLLLRRNLHDLVYAELHLGFDALHTLQ